VPRPEECGQPHCRSHTGGHQMWGERHCRSYRFGGRARAAGHVAGTGPSSENRTRGLESSSSRLHQIFSACPKPPRFRLSKKAQSMSSHVYDDSIAPSTCRSYNLPGKAARAQVASLFHYPTIYFDTWPGNFSCFCGIFSFSLLGAMHARRTAVSIGRVDQVLNLLA